MSEFFFFFGLLTLNGNGSSTGWQISDKVFHNCEHKIQFKQFFLLYSFNRESKQLQREIFSLCCIIFSSKNLNIQKKLAAKWSKLSFSSGMLAACRGHIFCMQRAFINVEAVDVFC